MTNKKQTDELKKELEFLYFVAKNVNSIELDELLKQIVNIAIDITGGDSCLVYVLDNKKKELVLRASKNPHSNLLKKIKIKLGEGITGWVAQEQKPLAISKGAALDPRFKFFRNLPEDRYEAFLSVPIVNKRGVCGVINIQHKKEHQHAFAEINLLTAIGKLAGGAVENALLIEETLALREALEFRKTVEKAKGILMKNRKITENEAYDFIQKQSMDTRKSLKDIAEAIILADQMKL